MKILVYGLANGWGGVESIVVNIMSCLDCQFDVILSPSECSYMEKLDRPNIKVIRMKMWGENPFRFKVELINILKQSYYDFVWINACLMSNITVLKQVKKYSKAKIITHSHGSSFEENSKFKSCILLLLHKLNRSEYLKLLDIPCSCSIESANWFYGKKYVKMKNLYIIKNGIDFTKYQYNENTRYRLRRELEIDDQSLALIHAGRLTHVKNQSKILEIVRELLSRGCRVKLFIAGEGELLSDLKKYADVLEIGNYVRFLGQREDIDEIMQAGDIFLLPSFHEGFPVTLVEAQSAGLPCLVSDTISNEVNITGRVKFLSLSESSSSWANQILKFDLNNRETISLGVENERYDIVNVSNSFYKHIIKWLNH